MAKSNKKTKQKNPMSNYFLITVIIIAVAIIFSIYFTKKSDTEYSPPPATNTTTGSNLVKSEFDALSRVKNDKTISSDWSAKAENANCNSKYYDLSTAVIFEGRVVFSENLLSCNTFYDILNVKAAAVSSGNPVYKEFVTMIENCNKTLIETFNKALKGQTTQYPIALDKTCSNCNEVFVIIMGCVNSGDKSKFVIDTAIVNFLDGKIYW